jgi:hypothetical protein
MPSIDDMIAELEAELRDTQQRAAVLRAGINALCAEAGRLPKFPEAIMPTARELARRD